MPEHWTVAVESPDGRVVKIVLSPEQVRYFMGSGMKNEFSTAAYLAYCDLWTRKDLDREESADVQQADAC